MEPRISNVTPRPIWQKRPFSMVTGRIHRRFAFLQVRHRLHRGAFPMYRNDHQDRIAPLPPRTACAKRSMYEHRFRPPQPMKPLTMLRIAMAAVLGLISREAFAGEAAVTVEVKDENGAPVSGATVTAAWPTPLPRGSGWGAGAAKFSQAQTDAAGTCSLPVGGADGNVSVTKDGYYWSRSGHEYVKQFSNSAWALIHAHEAMILIRKVHPVPMYVRSIRNLPIPERGIPIGFDMIAGEWVKPYGSGVHADVVVKATSEIHGPQNYD